MSRALGGGLGHLCSGPPCVVVNFPVVLGGSGGGGWIWDSLLKREIYVVKVDFPLVFGVSGVSLRLDFR